MKLTEQIERLERCAALLREVRDVLATWENAQPWKAGALGAPLSDAGEERVSFLNVFACGNANVTPSLQLFLRPSSIAERRETFKLLLQHFRVPGIANENYPETLRLHVERGGPVIIEVWNVPRAFKVECETIKNCVAVFPDGRRMPLAEAEKLEAGATE